MIARVVRAHKRFNFDANSAEEEELELVAYASLCAHALRYDDSKRRTGPPGQLFQGWSKRGILKECVRAAEKLRARGLTQLPQADKAKPRCQTCTEYISGLSGGGPSRPPGAEEAEADEPVLLSSDEVSLLRPVTNQYAFSLPARAGQNARIDSMRKRPEELRSADCGVRIKRQSIRTPQSALRNSSGPKPGALGGSDNPGPTQE